MKYESPGRKEVNDWLHAIGRNNGLSIHLNENDFCAINTGDLKDLKTSIPHEQHTLIVVRLSKDGASVKLVAYIGDEKYRDNAMVLEKVLHFNYGSDFLNGCTIGLCPESSRFALQAALPIVSLDETGFVNFVYNFALTHSSTQSKIRELTQNNYSSVVKQPTGSSDAFSNPGWISI